MRARCMAAAARIASASATRPSADWTSEYTTSVVSSSTASSAGSYPLLKRVFAYWNGNVGYSPTLSGALAQVFGTSQSTPSGPSGTGPSPGGTSSSSLKYIEQAQHYYVLAQAALKQDNLASYGHYLSLMQAALARARL